MVWLRISPDMDFYLETELQGVTEKTREEDVQLYNESVYEAFVERLRKAFPEGDFHVHNIEFGIAREKYVKAA